MSVATLFTPAPAAVAPAGSGDFKGGHYYGQDDAGNWIPLYAPGKNFTLREARKLHADGKVAAPSVTTYMGTIAKPQLDQWKQENVAKACWAQHFASTIWHGEDEWVYAALATASGASKGAMDLGTQIHGAIENFVGGVDYDADMQVYVDAVAKERTRLGITKSYPEISIGSLKYGYAGRCDDHTDDLLILDYKSRKSTGKKKVASYETDSVQLAAYGFARFGNEFFKSGRGAIFAISTTEPGLVTVHEWTGAALVQPFEAFLAMTAVWRFTNNFDPRRSITGT